MALLGINPVSAPRPVQQDPGPSDFEKLVMGLQAAQSAFGIYADYTKLQQQQQQAPLAFETAQAGLEKTRAQTGKLKAETTDIIGQPAIRERKRLDERSEKIGSDVIKFRQTDQYKKNVGGVLAARYVQKALEQKSGAGDFIAAVETIRGVAGDVGPMKESELDFIKGRMGLSEKVSGFFDKWANNQALQESERIALLRAVNAASQQRRSILTDLETQAARDIAAKYRDVNFGDVYPTLNSAETFRVGDVQLDKLRSKPPGGSPTRVGAVVPQTPDEEAKEKNVLLRSYETLIENLGFGNAN